jgi:hypothetical protein
MQHLEAFDMQPVMRNRTVRLMAAYVSPTRPDRIPEQRIPFFMERDVNANYLK